ncbi:hypothetical protein [Nitrobacter hamburgensis]|uniref:hypothetical protein n=1 Tax=Nitrobacter hamburgensis TaxID=912 RepID=UPI0003014144|nr:hypothetical protein [Nitrobacter hamburgensis]
MNEFGNEAAPVTGHDYVSAVEFLAAQTEVAGKERGWEIGRNGIISGRLRIHTCIQPASRLTPDQQLSSVPKSVGRHVVA